jgi:tetratricopeptide (TPR) repeat protein
MTLARFTLTLLLAALPAFSLASTAGLQEASQAFRQGNNTAALNHINGYLAANPKDAQGRFLKGLILTEMNRLAEAVRMFTELTEDYPELPEPYNNLAVLYAAQADYERAKQSLEMAIRTHPSYATAHENLGDIYAKMASQAYDKALQLDRSNTSAQTKLALIRDLFSPAARNDQATTPAAPVAAPPATPPAPAAQAKADDTRPRAPAAGDARQEIERTVRAWAEAWSARDADAYLGFYGTGFKTPNDDRAAWETQRRERLTRPNFIRVTLDELRVNVSDADNARVSFRQRYESNLLRNTSRKTLTLAREDGTWKIVEER